MLSLVLLSVTVGCAINRGDICTVDYLSASRKDTPKTQAEIEAHNELLKKQGCPEKKSAEPGAATPVRSGLLGDLQTFIGR